jgi:hypothetical protein
MRLQNPYQFCWTILVLIALMVQSFKFNFVIADYYVNTTNYIKNCINKSKPQSTCQGKCQMMKKMREEQQKEEQSSGNSNQKKGEQVIYVNDVLSSYDFDFTNQKISYLMFEKGKLLFYYSQPFRPPIIA